MIKVLFAGEGGQGVQVIAEILAKAAFNEGKQSLYIPNFGVEQRGGTSLAFVVIDTKPVVYPKFEKADILVIFADRSIERVQRYINDKTKVLLSPGISQTVSSATKLEPGDLPNRAWNVLALGRVNKIAKIVNQESLIKTMDERFSRQFKANPGLREIDLKAIRQ